MILGVLSGLSAAFVLAASSLMVKAQASQIDPFSFNTFRFLVAGVFFLLITPIFGSFQQLDQLQPITYLVLIVSVVLGYCVGDSLYFWSLTAIGASRAMPLSGMYPVFTWLLAVPLLGETVDWLDIAGTLLILAALYLLTRGEALTEANDYVLAPPVMQAVTVPRAGVSESRLRTLGIGAALLTALCWAAGTTTLALALKEEPNLLGITTIRVVMAGLLLLPILYWVRGGRPWQNYTRVALPSLIALALFVSVLGNLLFAWAVEYAGAARAALLITASPLIGVPLSAIFLKEKITRRVWVGTLLTVLGVWLVLV